MTETQNDRETETQRDGNRDRETETETDGYRETETETDGDRMKSISIIIFASYVVVISGPDYFFFLFRFSMKKPYAGYASWHGSCLTRPCVAERLYFN